MTFNDVHPGDPIDASNVQQVIDALKGTAAKGVPLAVTAVNNATNYALTLENIEATNSRALNVLKSDGTTLIKADATGVTLGAPLTLPPSWQAPTSSVTSASITDGTIQSADIAAAGIANSNLGPDVARANLLTNGGFEIWQRGNGPFTTALTADMWSIGVAGTDTLSVGRDTSNVDIGSLNCAACTFTLGTGAGASRLSQQINTTDNTGLKGRTLSLSMRVRTSVGNAVRIGINNFYASASHITYSNFHSGGGAYETLSVTAAIDPTATYVFPAVYFNASCTAYIDNAMLVVGSQPANYVPLHPADDLARCLRYYQRWQPGVSGATTGQGQCYSTSGALFAPPVQARLAVTPSFTSSNPATDWNAYTAAAAAVACGSITMQSASPVGFLLNMTGANSLVAGNATTMVTANANAWWAAEANP